MNIEDLLNINLSELHNFSLRANLIENEQNKRVIERNKTILRRIEHSHMYAGDQIELPQRTINGVIDKINRLANGVSEELTSRELRILTYNLDRLTGNDPIYKRALDILEKNWKNVFFNGLVYFLMSSWGDLDKPQFTLASSLLTRRLKAYNDFNKRYLLFKDHISLFEENGPVRMCALVKAKNIKLEEAPNIICLNRSSFSQSYYDDVIVSYFSRDNLSNLAYIEEVLSLHNSTKTGKLVFANLIIDADTNCDDGRQLEISNSARKILGDISLSATWAPFWGATEDEVYKLKRAYDIVKFWHAKQIIQTFFDVCVQDPDRKSFWLNHINEISDFRIVGSSSIRSTLTSDPRVKQQLPKIFVETNSAKNKTAALIMYIRDKVFVEFSDTGSVYIYPPSHFAVRSLKSRKYTDNINNLKDTSIGKAVDQDYYYTIYNDFGFLRHAGAWQERLNSWMIRKITSQPSIHIHDAENMFNMPPAPGHSRERQKTITNTKSGVGPSIARSEYAQKNLFDFVDAPKKDAEMPQNGTQLPILIKSEHIFDGQFQIGIAVDGVYIRKVSDGHIRKLRSCKVNLSTKGHILIKRKRTDGYLPIVFSENGIQESLGRIKITYDTIFYWDEFSSVELINVSDI